MDIEEVILFQIERTSKLSKIYSQREFDKLGMNITVEQWILLKIIHENTGLTQKELAEKSLRDPASITRTLDLLNKKGFVERKVVPGNRRQYSICLTKNGKGFISKYMSVITAHRTKSTGGMSEKELKALMQSLKRIQNNMS